MFSFLGSIFGKIASVVTSVFVAIGLVSAPASIVPQPTPPEPQVQVEQSQAQVEEQKPAEPEVDVKAELDALKKQLADEQKKRKDLEKKVLAPAPKPAQTLAPAPVVATPPSAPAPVVVAPTPTPTPTAPAIQLLPGQFMTPSGAIVDSTGKVVKAAPIPANIPPTTSPSSTSGQATTTPTPPPPAPVWPPTEGSTVDIQRSVFSVINFNNHLTCDQLLSLSASKKDLCKLYKEKQSQYTWNIIEDL